MMSKNQAVDAPVERMVRLGDVIDALSRPDLGYLKGAEFIVPIKMSHGSCCCCTTCGQYHDDCVCLHNELLAVLLAINEQPNVKVRGCATDEQ